MPSDCQEALGMESGDMPDNQLIASSEGEGTFNGEPFHYSAKYGRLNRRYWPMCWSPSESDENQWFQVHLGKYYTYVTRITTQGCPLSTEWTASYKLQYGNDGVNFQYYKERGQSEDKVKDTYNVLLNYICDPVIVSLLMINNYNNHNSLVVVALSSRFRVQTVIKACLDLLGF